MASPSGSVACTSCVMVLPSDTVLSSIVAIVGALSGGVVVVAYAEADQSLSPMAFVALTCTIYSDPWSRPVISYESVVVVAVLAATSQSSPLFAHRRSYCIMGESGLDGAVHDASMRALPATSIGASGVFGALGE